MEDVVVRQIELVELAATAAGAVLMIVTAVSLVSHAPDPTPLVLVKVNVNGEVAAPVIVAVVEACVELLIVTPVDGLTAH
jgi:hypothetical protein